MKYVCKRCGDPCFIEFEDDCGFSPTHCPFDGELDAAWRKLEKKALPKLTVEALAERGIEWPEWATCAVVGRGGFAYHCEGRPEAKKDGTRFHGRVASIPGEWEPNSLIMRPGKVETPQLPDWLKVGAWAAVGKFVGKIDWISRDGSECRITCGESRFAKTGEVKAVTWRAWTRSEWCEQIGKRFQFNNGVRMLLSVIERDGKFEVEFLGGSYCENDDILNENIKQLSGLPCGVPQVEGVDLEIRPCD